MGAGKRQGAGGRKGGGEGEREGGSETLTSTGMSINADIIAEIL